MESSKRGVSVLVLMALLLVSNFAPLALARCGSESPMNNGCPGSSCNILGSDNCCGGCMCIPVGIFVGVCAGGCCNSLSSDLDHTPKTDGLDDALLPNSRIRLRI
ncbi:hypothetical protein Tsubulata_019670 [Turnera subulata]|uniref:Uncharacterized protein n=1 Tax=Turnera subulata TaxID=218843 RepID=A0A9Q0FQY9_9ROSI|nr:hypothetical protein Tsubulata_019670 [Turnera subulata]